MQIQLSKTTKIGATPWKWQVEVNYYVEQPNAFGPKWMMGLNVTPVVKNVVQEWIEQVF